ncbi:flagellar assembly protein H [Catenovulum agarivorans DS-2]|uniref:Flagellar assembly protein FliH n=1 Tax=Catenovulum agarivorans DS-2 TaxID=1328313 RepID=W7QCT3_9ALTE|nr:flagellar assembly protein FliH [Catenovulum agarivorans]EWH09726.1 flagellar assembly protein H [Catenovulum agarivorans DS-2]
MTEDQRKLNKAVLSEQAKADAKAWHIPVVEDDGTHVPEGYTNALGKKKGWVYEEPEPEPEPPKPPTIEEIEAIRQAAYDEGFNEGKAEGFAKGEAEGKEQGYQEGFAAGQEAGHADGLASGTGLMEEKAQIWNQLISQLDNPIEQLDEQVESELIDLAVALAKQVIQTELTTNPDIIQQSLKQAADKLPFNTQQCFILVNPEDFEQVVSQYGEQELARRNWHIQTDPNVSRGSVEIKTETSSISFDINQRVKEVFDQFL